MISFSKLAQLSFHFTCPNKVNRKDFWLAFIFPAGIGLFLSLLPIVFWETIYLLVVVGIFPEKLLLIINFFTKIFVFFAFGTPLLYTYIIASIKRLHDIGHSGLWWLLNLISIPILFLINYLGYDWVSLMGYVILGVIILFTVYLSFSKSKKVFDECA